MKTMKKFDVLGIRVVCILQDLNFRQIWPACGKRKILDHVICIRFKVIGTLLCFDFLHFYEEEQLKGLSVGFFGQLAIFIRL